VTSRAWNRCSSSTIPTAELRFGAAKKKSVRLTQQVEAVRTLGLTLVTHNLAEFSRVPGLLVQNWLS